MIGDGDCSGRSWSFQEETGEKRKGKEEEEGGKEKGGSRGEIIQDQ